MRLVKFALALLFVTLAAVTGTFGGFEFADMKRETESLRSGLKLALQQARNKDQELINKDALKRAKLIIEPWVADEERAKDKLILVIANPPSRMISRLDAVIALVEEGEISKADDEIDSLLKFGPLPWARYRREKESLGTLLCSAGGLSALGVPIMCLIITVALCRSLGTRKQTGVP